MARIACADQSMWHHALVPLRASNNDEVRAFHEKARLPSSFWSFISRLVHLPPNYSFNFDASFRFLALQIAAGCHQFRRLSRLLRDDGIAVA